MADLPALDTQTEIRKVLKFRSRAGFLDLLRRDPELQACTVRFGPRRVLFDREKVLQYIDRRRSPAREPRLTPRRGQR